MFRGRALLPILLVLALASIMAATSFSSASIQVNGKLNIVDTTSGLVGLLPGSISRVENNQLVLDLNSGLQTNSSYTFSNAFSIKNNSPETLILRYSGLSLGEYGKVETKAYLPGVDQYYNNALEEGFPLHSGQVAEITLLISVGDQKVNLTNMDFDITAKKGDSTANPPHDGPIPDGANNNGSSGNDENIDCDNPGQCLGIAKDLLDQLRELKDWLDNDQSKENYDLARNWFVNLNKMALDLKNRVDKLSDNGHNSNSELGKTMNDIDNIIEQIIHQLDNLKKSNIV